MSNKNDATANAPSELMGIIVLQSRRCRLGEPSVKAQRLTFFRTPAIPTVTHMKRRLPKSHLTHTKECSARNYATLMSLYSAYGSVNYPMIVPVGDASCTCVPQAKLTDKSIANE